MASRKKKTWVYNPPRKPKSKIPDEIKQELQKKGDEIVKKLKPKYVEPIPDPQILNHLIDIYTKWYRSYFYFCSKYKCAPDAYAEYFESKFARMEYLGNNKFELSYMRHTGKWWPTETSTMDECLESVSAMVPY